MLRTMVGAVSMLSFSLVGAILADEAEPSFEKSATLSIVAVDPENGICGAAVASKYPAVGKVVPYVRAGVGAFCTQHWHVPKWGERALDLLEAGKRPEAVFLELLKDDEQAEQRQLGIVDIYGRTAVHNPTASGKKSYYFGAMTGQQDAGPTGNGQQEKKDMIDPARYGHDSLLHGIGDHGSDPRHIHFSVCLPGGVWKMYHRERYTSIARSYASR